MRNCLLEAPCCEKLFPCRFCHDESQDHKIDRYVIENIACISCREVQPVAKECRKCNQEMAHYFCKKCNFFDNDTTKDIFHCDKCNICRIGKSTDYIHCDKCNACWHISLENNHKCIENSLDSNCPICNEYLFFSVTPVMLAVCGHPIHVECYEKYIKVNYTCPICSKSLCDMSSNISRVDEFMENSQMPEEFQHMKSNIICCDCEEHCTVPFHFSYHKCINCGSYNTKVKSTESDVLEASGTSLETENPVYIPR